MAILVVLTQKSIGTKAKYKPFLNSNHFNHQIMQSKNHYLYKFIQNHFNTHPIRLLYALVITKSPLSLQCNLLLFDHRIHIYNLFNCMKQSSTLYPLHLVKLLNIELPRNNKLSNIIHKNCTTQLQLAIHKPH